MHVIWPNSLLWSTGKYTTRIKQNMRLGFAQTTALGFIFIVTASQMCEKIPVYHYQDWKQYRYRGVQNMTLPAIVKFVTENVAWLKLSRLEKIQVKRCAKHHITCHRQVCDRECCLVWCRDVQYHDCEDTPNQHLSQPQIMNCYQSVHHIMLTSWFFSLLLFWTLSLSFVSSFWAD